ncbi:MAG: HAD-IIIA family hydrolase [Candidatus Micrarchaeia archaeon]
MIEEAGAMLELVQRIFLIAKADFTGKCAPDLKLESVLGLDPGWLDSNGIKCVIFDADNTLFPHHAGRAGSKTLAFLKSLSRKYRLGIASNAPNEARVAQLENYFRAKGVKIAVSRGKGKKPLPGQFEYIAKKFSLKPAQCAMVGDNLFTDIAGAKLAGMKAVKVRPYDQKSEPWHFAFMRFLEKALE